MSRIIWRKLGHGDKLEEGDGYIAHTSGDLNNPQPLTNHKERTICFINALYLGGDAGAFTGLVFWRPIGIHTPPAEPVHEERKIELEL